jgi:ubiquinone/menaquinone biosynthesis C-methylase UbiE
MPQRGKKERKHTTHSLPASHTKAYLLRLSQKERWITRHLGGVLAEQAEPGRFHQVLDVGSGLGCWVIDTALAYPTMSLVGIEIDPSLVRFARVEARTAQISEHVVFHCMDALQPLAFADASFDLVNLSLGGTFLRTWEWPKVLRECARILKPGGTLRLVEMELMTLSKSAATLQLCQVIATAFFHAGHVFEPTPDGLTAHLERLLHQQGYQHIQARTTTVAAKAGSALQQGIYQYFLHTLPTFQPFVCKWYGIDPQEYGRLSRQALAESSHEDASSETTFVTL